jgi:PTH1 family peptidyl-tRNA hydrolase
MSIIAGLGNIGGEYDGTRHNIGFEIADRLADKLSLQFSAGQGSYLVAEGTFKSKPVIIIKPTTYMNLSGSALTKAIVKYKTPLDRCLVCYDDLNLPVGKIRFRENGAAGGHNGVQNIIDRTGTRNFPRLRFGIGNDFPRGRQVDYVLGVFPESDQPELEAAIERALEGILCFVREGINTTMNRFNQK